MPSLPNDFYLGKLDAPDIETTTALNKIALNIPLTDKEVRRITVRQMIEQDRQKQADQLADRIAKRNIIGATPKYDQEAAADRILRERFGSFAPGQVRTAPSTPSYPRTYTEGQTTPGGLTLGQGESVTINPWWAQESAKAASTPQVQQPIQAPSVPQQAPDTFNYKTQPLQQFGILGQPSQPAPMPDVSSVVASYAPKPVAQQPSYQTPMAGLPQTPAQTPSIIGGTPIQTAANQLRQAPAPILGQGTYSSVWNTPSAISPAPAPSDIIGSALARSPQGQHLAMQQQQFALAQQDRQLAEQKRLIEEAAYAKASGQDISALGIPPQFIGQVNMMANEIQNKATPKTDIVELKNTDKATGDTVVQQVDSRTNKVLGTYRIPMPITVGTPQPGTVVTRTAEGGFISKNIPGAPESEQQQAVRLQEEQKVKASNIIRNAVSDVLALNDLGAIKNPNNPFLKNLQAGIGSSAVGQALSGIAGTQAQAIRDRLSATSAALIPALAAATGLKSSQLNSNQELKFYLQMMADPNKDFLTNLAALDALNKKIGGPDVVTEMLQDQPEALAAIRRTSSIMSRNHPLDLTIAGKTTTAGQKFQVGEKRRQGGKVYQYDGQNWNEIK